jgi:hypothetical protein
MAAIGWKGHREKVMGENIRVLGAWYRENPNIETES